MLHPQVRDLVTDGYHYRGYEYAITITPAYMCGSLQHHPVVTLRISNIIYDAMICGLEGKRWSWLPSWFPFNHCWDCSIPAQVEMLTRLHRRAQRICSRMEQSGTNAAAAE